GHVHHADTHVRRANAGDPLAGAGAVPAENRLSGVPQVMAAPGLRRTAPEPSRLSLNTATVKKQWKLGQIIDACARHGIPGIAPWRDQVAEFGLEQTARLIKTHGLTVSGLCRGGFFT